MVSDTVLVKYATQIYSAGQTICALMLYLALFEVALKTKSRILEDDILARLAMLYVPFAAIKKAVDS